MIKTKKQMFTIIGSFLLVMLLTTVTYAFFNYTRTGSNNIIKTGRIYFSSTQNGTLNLTNLFPVASNEVGDSNEIEVRVYGDTTYTGGEEFEISLVSVNNSITSESTKKAIPINYIASYERTPVATGEAPNNIGTSSNDYFTDRGSSTAVYQLSASGAVSEGEQVLIGYIPKDVAVDGTLTIKAYLDRSNIAISDTYPAIDRVYIVNSNMTQSEINACKSLITGLYGPESSAEGANQTVEGDETYADFCAGTGTIFGHTLQDFVNSERFSDEEFVYLEENNIIIFQGYSNGTTDEWVRGRTVITTDEWNTLQNTPISFKIKAVANEGTWVEES